jgi:hypothetical protein
MASYCDSGWLFSPWNCVAGCYGISIFKTTPLFIGRKINKEKYEGAVRCSLGGWYGGNVEESA